MLLSSSKTIAGLILSLTCLTQIASAQDCDDLLACDRVEESGDPFFSETSNHPGLLGKPYLDVRYIHLQDDELAFVPGFDDSLQGLIVSGNVPLAPLDAIPGPLHFDLYSEFMFATLDGAGNLGPDLGNLYGELEVEGGSFGIGLTAFAALTDHIRPFIQLGYEYFHLEARISVAPLSLSREDSESGLMLNVGSEFDLAKRLAARVMVDVTTEDEIDDSRLTTELIFWPFKRVYLRGGVDIPFDAENVGALIGAGVIF